MAETNGWLTIPDPFASLSFARAGFDSLTIDMQHGLFDEAAMVRTLMALDASPRRIVRTVSNEPGMIGKALDAGADGVIAPLISTATDATRRARACRYPPHGSRSYGPVLASLRANHQERGDPPHLEVWAMIETREGLDQIDAIASVEGITGLFVGPNDLALALGLPPGSDRQEPVLLAAFARVVEAAHAVSKRAALFCASGSYGRRAAAMGFDRVTLLTDVAALREGAASALAAFNSQAA